MNFPLSIKKKKNLEWKTKNNFFKNLEKASPLRGGIQSLFLPKLRLNWKYKFELSVNTKCYFYTVK